MTVAEVIACSLTDLVHEAHRHSLAKPLAIELSRVCDLYHRGEGDWYTVTIQATFLRGFLARHLEDAPVPVAAHAVPFAGCIPAPTTDRTAARAAEE